VLKLHSEQKKMTANMTFLQFCRDVPLVPTGVVSIPKEKLKVINADSPTRKRKA